MAGMLEHNSALELLEANEIRAKSSLNEGVLEPSTSPQTHKLLLASAQLTTLVDALEQLHTGTSQASLVIKDHIGDAAVANGPLGSVGGSHDVGSSRSPSYSSIKSLLNEINKLFQEMSKNPSGSLLNELMQDLMKAMNDINELKNSSMSQKDKNNLTNDLKAIMNALFGDDPSLNPWPGGGPSKDGNILLTWLDYLMKSTGYKEGTVPSNEEYQKILKYMEEVKNFARELSQFLPADDQKGWAEELSYLNEAWWPTPSQEHTKQYIMGQIEGFNDTGSYSQYNSNNPGNSAFNQIRSAASAVNNANKSLNNPDNTPQYWKQWLEKLMEFFQSNWTGENFTDFMLMLLKGVSKEGDMPPNIKAEFKKLLVSVIKELKKEENSSTYGNDFSKMIEDITLALGHAMGSFSEAEKLMQEMLSQGGAAPINWAYYNEEAAQGWAAIEQHVTQDLIVYSEQYFTPGLRAAIQPEMNHMFGACIAHESVWEKVADLLGTWDYSIFNSIMDVQNMIMQEIQKIRNDLNEAQQDLDNMANNPNDTASAKDFLEKMADLKKLSASRWLGSGSGSSGEALNKFLTFLNGWGDSVFSKTPPNYQHIAAVVHSFMTAHGTSPTPEQQQITTNFSNMLGTFSTASETQSMALQNSETQLDANLKINNSVRQTMTSLIHVITNYSNG